MIKKIRSRIAFFRSIRLLTYLKLNYFSKSVIRTDRNRIIPYKYAVIDLAKDAKIILGGGDLEIGCNSLRGSRTETRVRMYPGAIWTLEGGTKISYGATVEILEDAWLDTGYFTINSGSVLVAAKKISFGQDVMIGRNVTIYDSDFHRITGMDGKVLNPASPVKLGDHVWIASNAMVLKGVEIGENTIVGGGTVITRNVEAGMMAKPQSGFAVRRVDGNWNRKKP